MQKTGCNHGDERREQLLRDRVSEVWSIVPKESMPKVRYEERMKHMKPQSMRMHHMPALFVQPEQFWVCALGGKEFEALLLPPVLSI